jgi:hypothetical protein
LKGRRLNLFVSRRGFEVEQSLDVSAHRYLQIKDCAVVPNG